MPFSEPPKILPFSFGSNSIKEGGIAQLMCFVNEGDEPLSISWYLKGDTLSSDPSITTTMIGTRTSMLMITNVGYRHSGTYSCRATNHAGSISETAELKVNGRKCEGSEDFERFHRMNSAAGNDYQPTLKEF